MIVGAVLLLLGMVIFSALESRFPIDPARRWWRRRFLADVMLWLVHPVSSACGMAIAAAVTRALPQPAFASSVALLPHWLQLVVAFVAADLAAYALHRAYHRVPVLWAFHVVHHTSKELDWLSTSRLHPLSQAINAALVAAPLFVYGLPVGAVVFANALIGLWAIFVHANVRFNLGKLGAVVVSPTFHRHHHGRGVGAKNLGAVLTLWDRLFGSWEKPSHVPIGAEEVVNDDALGLLLHPFTRVRSARNRPATQ